MHRILVSLGLAIALTATATAEQKPTESAAESAGYGDMTCESFLALADHAEKDLKAAPDGDTPTVKKFISILLWMHGYVEGRLEADTVNWSGGDSHPAPDIETFTDHVGTLCGHSPTYTLRRIATLEAAYVEYTARRK